MKFFNSHPRIEHPVWKLTQRWGLCLLLFSIVDYPPPPFWSNLRTGENFVVSSRHRRLWTWSNFPETPGQIPLAYRKKWWLLFFWGGGKFAANSQTQRLPQPSQPHRVNSTVTLLNESFLGRLQVGHILVFFRQGFHRRETRHLHCVESKIKNKQTTVCKDVYGPKVSIQTSVKDNDTAFFAA